jgi:uncharacterized protein YdeI (YjbR/CyaY-like superfamily)
MVVCRSRREWRAWLRANHAKAKEASLVFYKKHTGRATLAYDEAVEEALCFGWIDGIKRSLDGDTYTYRFTPRRPESKWSAINKARVDRLIAAGEMTAAGLSVLERAKLDGSYDEVPDAERRWDVPAELSSLLAKRKRAKAAFDALAPGYRRRYLQWIASAKKAETRSKRALEVVDRLGRGEKLGTK